MGGFGTGREIKSYFKALQGLILCAEIYFSGSVVWATSLTRSVVLAAGSGHRAAPGAAGGGGAAPGAHRPEGAAARVRVHRRCAHHLRLRSVSKMQLS